MGRLHTDFSHSIPSANPSRSLQYTSGARLPSDRQMDHMCCTLSPGRWPLLSVALSVRTWAYGWGADDKGRAASTREQPHVSLALYTYTPRAMSP
eukprot:840095-Pyramimonas_sp.AAC.1